MLPRARAAPLRAAAGPNGPLLYAAALAHPTDPIAFGHALTGLYATDPEYGAKLERVMRSRGLLETFGGPPSGAA